jgi:hypothetical protein
MIAEYERAQILERSRRGKRHRAQSGEVSVMSGAPYVYRYIRKTDETLAAYAGLYCATLPIAVSPVSARPAPLHGCALSVRCVGGV